LALCLLGAFVAPLVLCAIYLDLTRPLPWGVESGTPTDWLVIVVAVGSGAACLLGLPWPWLYRILVTVVYVPAFGYAFLVFWMLYECAQTGDWL
jgi:hypothetical protein